MKNLLKLSAILLLATNAWASGSTDYVCSQVNGNIRYTYHAGEDINAELFRVAGLDVKKATQALVTQNRTYLGSYEVVDLLIHGNSLNFVGCQEDDKQCLVSATSSIADKWTKVQSKVHNEQYDQIDNIAKDKSGNSITLSIHDYSTKTAEGEDGYSGTLVVQTKESAYADVANKPVKVRCTVTTP